MQPVPMPACICCGTIWVQVKALSRCIRFYAWLQRLFRVGGGAIGRVNHQTGGLEAGSKHKLSLVHQNHNMKIVSKKYTTSVH